MIISWNSTNKCNMFCAHCYRESGQEAQGELTTEQAKKMLTEIARAGFKIMIFSGGEPLLRPDIFELIAFATAQKLRCVLGTNGSLLTPKVVAQLKAAGLMGAGISLDSLDAAKHNRLRGLDKAWELAVAGMDNCRAAGLPFQIHTTVMDWNEQEVEALTDFAVDKGARAHHIFFLVPVGRGEALEGQALKQEAYEELLQRIMRKAQTVPIEVKPTCAPQFMRIAAEMKLPLRFSKGCLAGTAYCIIGPQGQVQPCAYMKINLGNVKTTAFDQLWREHPLLHTLRTEAYQGTCGTCQHQHICGGCRARAAYYNDGDYMAADPLCILHRER
ncbi:MAG: putative heme d1 biosynthesis radical SAM protein NirJ2 [Acidaminococcaceae bacterium]